MPAGERIVRGTAAFRRTTLALFSAGFSTFALMYCVQPILPELAREFGISAAESSLAVSLTTGCLAASLLVVAAVSESRGRKPLMVLSLLAAALLTAACAFTTDWRSLLLIRALEGVAFAGLPALAMAYIAEEMHADSMGLAMGLYVGGTATGGMAGRILTAVVADVASWRTALALVGGLGLLATVVVWLALPPSRHFRPGPLLPRTRLATYGRHLRDGVLRDLFLLGFLAMGCFVTVYNYVAFRLEAPPYLLGQSATGFIFTLYLLGTVSSAWVDRLARGVGRAGALRVSLSCMLAGTLSSLAAPLVLVVLSVAVFTVGFFAAHSVVSSWVGARGSHGRAQASSLYLCAYYLGSSLAGAAGGVFWDLFGWSGVGGFVTALLLVSLVLLRRLARDEASAVLAQSSVPG